MKPGPRLTSNLEMGVEPTRLLGETKRALLGHLREGSLGALELARLLGIDVNAVRKHLDSLENLGAVRPEFLRKGAGRPKKIYHLESAGLELFPRRYDLLFSLLLRDLLDNEGRAYAESALARMARSVAESLRLPGDGTPPQRLEALTEALNAMGFETRLGADEGRPCLINRNCVALQAASGHPELICRAFHSNLISAALGGASVELRGCIVRGDPACRHAVRLDLRDKKVSKLHKLQRPL